MTLYRITCKLHVERTSPVDNPPTATIYTVTNCSYSKQSIDNTTLFDVPLFFEETNDKNYADELYTKKMDENFLLKAGRTYPDAKYIEILEHSCSDSSDWKLVRSHTEFLP